MKASDSLVSEKGNYKLLLLLYKGIVELRFLSHFFFLRKNIRRLCTSILVFFFLVLFDDSDAEKKTFKKELNI